MPNEFKVLGRTFDNLNHAIIFAKLKAKKTGKEIPVQTIEVDFWKAPYRHTLFIANKKRKQKERN